MKLLKTSILSGVASVIKMLSGFIITKIIAVYGGPQGVAYLGQLQNFINIILLGAGNSFKTAIIKLTSEYSDNESKTYKIWSTVIIISLLSSFFFSFIIFIFRNEISFFLFNDRYQYSIVISAFSFSIPFFLINTILISIINGRQKVELLTKLNILGSVFTLVFILILCLKYGTIGALIGFATSQSITLFLSVLILFKKIKNNLYKLTVKIDTDIFKELFIYGFITIVSVTSANLSSFIIRDQIISYLSIDDAGIWQGLWSLLQALLTLLSMTMSVYFIPKVAKANNNSNVRVIVRNVIFFILPLMLLISFISSIFSEQIITLLFSREFISGETMFFLIMLVLPIKCIAWVYGYLLVINKKIKYVIFTETFSSLLFCILNYHFMRFFGFIGVGYALITISIIHLVMVRGLVFK